MAYERKSKNPPILIYMDWSDMLLKLSDADVGYIVKGMFLHRLGKELESREVEPLLDGLLDYFNAQSDKNAKSYAERCERYANNRKKNTNENEPRLTTVNKSEQSLTTVNDGQPRSRITSTSTSINTSTSTSTDTSTSTNTDINTSFSSNEEKGSEKETKEEDGCQDAGAASSVDPTTERGNPNFDLRKSYLAIKKRKAENRLKTGEYI